MTQHPDNVKRGERAAVALKTYTDRQDGLDCVRDLLTDLRHYCDTHGLDFLSEDDAAQDNYDSEFNDPVL